ncbi:MAG: hypothetical protein ACXADB_14660 [Candidatus Hermodarchaeia archaeon]|jgi:hypothetical protein
MKTYIVIILISALLGGVIGYGLNVLTITPEQNTQNQQLNTLTQQLEA